MNEILLRERELRWNQSYGWFTKFYEIRWDMNPPEDVLEICHLRDWSYPLVTTAAKQSVISRHQCEPYKEGSIYSSGHIFIQSKPLE